jgi:hypothetical protein
MDNEDIIHQCNFTKHEPTLAVRTFAGGLLGQGSDTVMSIPKITDYNVLSSITPVLVFAPLSILV